MPRRIAACATPLVVSFSVRIGTGNVNGIGSSLVYPIFSKWVDVYHKEHPGIQIAYLALGSGAGIAQTLTGMVDFGGTDAPVADAELSRAKIQILHVPVILGADVPAYNLPARKRPFVSLDSCWPTFSSEKSGTGTIRLSRR